MSFLLALLVFSEATAIVCCVDDAFNLSMSVELGRGGQVVAHLAECASCDAERTYHLSPLDVVVALRETTISLPVHKEFVDFASAEISVDAQLSVNDETPSRLSASLDSHMLTMLVDETRQGLTHFKCETGATMVCTTALPVRLSFALDATRIQPRVTLSSEVVDATRVRIDIQSGESFAIDGVVALTCGSLARSRDVHVEDEASAVFDVSSCLAGADTAHECTVALMAETLPTPIVHTLHLTEYAGSLLDVCDTAEFSATLEDGKLLIHNTNLRLFIQEAAALHELASPAGQDVIVALPLGTSCWLRGYNARGTLCVKRRVSRPALLNT